MAETDPGTALAGTGVLITRPRAQATRLASLVEAASGTALCFPTLEIVPTPDDNALHGALTQLGPGAVAIFVSTNAVTHALAALARAGRHWPAKVPAAAVGQATARALREAGIPDVLVPTERFDSEGLLALPALNIVRGQTVILFRGEGGRELLADALRARGAHVLEAACYRRARPLADTAPLLAWLRSGKISIVTATSVETLENLCAMVKPPAREQLLSLPLAVNSPRVAAAAKTLGFAQAPVISEQPSDEAILKAISAWRRGTTSR